MILPLRPAIGFVQAPAPSPGPLADYQVSGERVRLGLAGCGSIEVTRTSIFVLAPDALGYQRTIDRLGEWAHAQFLAAQGFRVMRGAVVARRGRAIALVGGSRCGASVLALILSHRGWGLVSDGLVIQDTHGFLRALDPTVTLDTEATVRMPPEVLMTHLTTGRDRVKVTTTGHPDAEIGAYVFLRVRQSLTQLEFAAVPFTSAAADALEDYRISSLLPGSAPPPPIVQAPCWRVARPAFSAHPEASTPPMLAALLMSSIDSALK